MTMTMYKCDLTYLKSISPGNPEFLKQIVLLFLKDTPLSIKEMANGAIEEDWGRVHLHTHKIKPSVELMGLPKEVVDLLFRINDQAKNQIDVKEIPSLIEEFEKKMTFLFEDLKSVVME